MLTAFQTLMIAITIFTFIGSVGERENKDLRNNMTALCISSIAGFILATWFL